MKTTSRLISILLGSMFLLGTVFSSVAQDARDYLFSQSMETYTPLLSPTILNTGTVDDEIFPVNLPNGVAFPFLGRMQTALTVSSNGHISFPNAAGLNSVTTSTQNVISASLSASGGAIASFAMDLKSRAGGQMSHAMDGDEFVIQWANFQRFSTSTDTINMQVRLNTTNGVVKIVYGFCKPGSSTSYPVVGIRGPLGIDYQTRKVATATGAWVNSVAGANASETCFFNSSTPTSRPLSGTTFTYTPPSCVRPASPSASLLTTTTARISWATPIVLPASGYEYVLTTNYNVPTETTVATGTSATSTIDLTNLQAGTSYYLWVRSVCSSTENSFWSSVAVFTTKRVATALPYVQDFEGTHDLTFVNGYQVNTWNVGTASANPGKAMYISNDFGVTNAYTFTTASRVFAYHDLVVPANPELATLSFDWKGRGESATADYLRVYIAPKTVNPVAGGSLTGATQIGGTFNQQTTWTNYLNANVNLSGFAGDTMRLIFEWYNDSSNGTNEPAAVDNIRLFFPACSKPLNLTHSNVGATSATISWISQTNAPADGYIYSLSTSNTAPDENATGVSVPTGLTTLIEGLTPSTVYYVWVRSACDATTFSDWSNVTSFTTTQIPAVLPYSQDFETANDIFISNGTQVNKWVTGTADGNPGAAMYISNDNGVSNAYTNTSTSRVYAYRDLAIPANAYLATLAFDWKAKAESNDFLRVWLVPTTYIPVPGAAISTSIGTAIASGLNLKDTWQNYRNTVINVSSYAGANVRLVFEWYNNATLGATPPAIVDNIQFFMPDCVVPTALTATNARGDGATISWTAPNPAPADGYEYYVSTSSTAPVDTTTATGTAATTTATVTGLTPLRTHYVWVRSICGANNKSQWTPTSVSFKTTQILATFPYTQDFETANDFEIVNGSGVNKWSYGSPTGNTGNLLYISNDGGATNAYRNTVSTRVFAYRDFEVPANAQLASLKFDWKANGEGIFDNMRVYLLPTTTVPVSGSSISQTNGQQIGGNFNNRTTWTTYTLNAINVRSFAGSTLRLVFEWQNDGSDGDNPPAAIDNIDFSLPSCLPATALAATQMTTTSGTLAWKAPVPAPDGGYEYYLSTSNTAPTAATVPTGTAVDTFANIINLNSGTTYYAWVRSVCDATSKSDWSIRGMMVTTCATITSFPWLETFEGAHQATSSFVAGVMANCWIGTGKAGVMTSANSNITTTSGDKALAFQYSTGLNTWAFSPDLQLEAGRAYRITFNYRNANTSAYDSLKVAFGSGQNAAAMTTQIGRVLRNITNTTYATYSADFVVPANGVFNFGIYAKAPSAPLYLMVDDVKIDYAPTCLTPLDLAVSTVTSTDATATWNNPVVVPTDGYAYYLSTSPTAPDATTVPTGVTASSPLLLSNLQEGTQYYIWVKANCSAIDASEWTSVVAFYTPQTPAVLPYTQDFEAGNDFRFMNGEVNNWAHGNATGNTGSSIYISNDGGTTNAYTMSGQPTRVFAYRDLAIPAGTTMAKLGFDWKGVGESASYDYMKVWITPASFEPTVGTAITSTNGMQIGGVYNLQSTWQTYFNDNVDLTNRAGQTARLIFEWYNDNGGGDNPPIAVDNVNIEMIYCFPGTALAFTNVTTTGATATWTAPGNAPANGYAYYVSTSNVAPTAATVPTGISTGTTVDITGLDPAVTYYFWVKSICSDTDESNWSTRGTFTTLCAVITTLPWTENFDQTTGATATFTSGVAPTCWKATGKFSVMTQGNSYITPRSGDKAFGIQWSTGTNTWAYTPEFALEAGVNYRYSFFYRNYSTTAFDSLRVFIGQGQTPAGMAGGRIGTVLRNIRNTTYAEYIVDFQVPADGVYNLGMNVSSGSSPMYMMIDDASLMITPCMDPTATLTGGTGACRVADFQPATITLTGVGPWKVKVRKGTNVEELNIASSPYSFLPQEGGTYELIEMSDLVCTGVATGTANFVYTPSSLAEQNVTICLGESYQVGASAYTTAGRYYNAFPAVDGCDSMVITNLVTYDGTPEGQYVDGMLKATPVAGAYYTWVNCDTDVVMSANQNYKPTANGNYKLVLNIDLCQKESICLTVGDVAVDQVSSTTFNVFPNPTLGKATVQTNGAIITRITVLDQKGQTLQSYTCNDSTAEITLENLSEGMYFLAIESEGASVIRKITKK